MHPVEETEFHVETDSVMRVSIDPPFIMHSVEETEFHVGTDSVMRVSIIHPFIMHSVEETEFNVEPTLSCGFPSFMLSSRTPSRKLNSMSGATLSCVTDVDIA